MAILISSREKLEGRIREYNLHAKDMAERMPYNRSWYAVRVGREWLFGPSKFVGYDNLSARQYLDNPVAEGIDGRVTEGVLQQWSELVEQGHPKYEELRLALSEFFARLGKKPNSLARISVVRSKNQEVSPETFPDELVSLMVAVYQRLTPAQKSTFQRMAD